MTERLTLTDAVDALKGLYGLLQLRNASDPGWESNHRAVDARRVMALAEAHGTAPLPETQPREGDDHPGTIAPLKGDTPRTDAKVFSVTIAGGNHNVVFAEDARQLERELAEAKRELEAETALATRTMVERDALERRLAVSATQPRSSPFTGKVTCQPSGDDWVLNDQERQVAIVASRRHAEFVCAAVNEYDDLLAVANSTMSAIPRSSGAYNWIKDASAALRAVNKAHPLDDKLFAQIQDLLMGVPVPQEDLGFNSPADRAARSTSGARPTEQQVADILTTLELARFRAWNDGVDHLKVGSSAEYDKVRAFLISLAPNVVLPEHEQKPTFCPHADPHVYCQTCKVSPCPLGLDASRVQSATGTSKP